VIPAIIVAAGKGVRMNADTKKQYLQLGGNPIIIRTLRIFSDCPSVGIVCLVVPPSDDAYCRELVHKYPAIRAKCRVVHGGETRQASVYQGLRVLEKEVAAGDPVIIHDGVRPLVTVEQIESCVASAEENGACILALPAQDTLKKVEGASGIITGTLKRQNVWLAQTPQVFRYALIRDAHELALKDGFTGTDDAMLVERMPHPVHVVPGSRTNLKVTTPDDLALAQALVSVQQ
jgi:2-C-methyl-D-erythritol 4-phosphate cytidylyltransferase